MSPKTIPDGQGRATPYLCVNDGMRAIEFYRKAFDATEVMRLTQPDGRIGHAELKIGPADLWLSDEFAEIGIRAPKSLGGTPVTIHLYVADVDAVVARAVAAGATLERPVADQFYGDRSGNLVDPFGHRWMIATHKEDVSPAEMQRRFAALYK